MAGPCRTASSTCKQESLNHRPSEHLNLEARGPKSSHCACNQPQVRPRQGREATRDGQEGSHSPPVWGFGILSWLLIWLLVTSPAFCGVAASTLRSACVGRLPTPQLPPSPLDWLRLCSMSPMALLCRCPGGHPPHRPEAGPQLADFPHGVKCSSPVLPHILHHADTQLCQLFGLPSNSAPQKASGPPWMVPC